MADMVFHVGESDAPIHIVHHVGTPVPKDGRFYSVKELFTRRIWVNGEEKEETSSYVTYKIARQPDNHAYVDDLRAGYTYKPEPEINLEHRRLEVL